MHGYVVLCCLVSLFSVSWLHPQIAWASLVETGVGRGYTHKDQNGLEHIGVYYMPEVNLCYHVYIY